MDKLRATAAPDGNAEIQENEIAPSNGTRPPLNFISILRDAGIPIDTSSPYTLSDQLYAGVFLKPGKLKYFVDKKSNKNGFVFFARELLGQDTPEEYWAWTTERDASGVDIEVVELLAICWLEISGSIWTVNLSPRTLYEIVFVIMIKKEDSNISNFSLQLGINPPHSEPITHHVSLKEKPSDQWIEIQVGEFLMSPQMVGHTKFYLKETSPPWKRGLFLKCAVIRPKN